MAKLPSKSGNIQELFSASSNGDNDPLINHLFEESAALNVYDKTIINLAAGAPGPDLLSGLTSIMREATLHRMEQEESNNHYLFQYGPTAGLWGLREALSKFLSKNYGHNVNRSDLVLTCGASNGLHLAVSIFLQPDAVIFVEEYTYMIALSTLKEFPAHRIIKVPMSKSGVDVDKFESIVKDAKKSSAGKTSENKMFWAMFYCIPTFQNPTGTLLPPESCQKLVRVARQQDVLVICDDVYNLLHFGDGNPPARLFSYDDPGSSDYAGGHVISNGSFSKIMAPGLRVGWMEMSPKLVKRYRQSGILQSGGSMNNVMYGILQSVIELGLADKHLQWYREIYKARITALCKSLRENLPRECSFLEPQGGYFVWIEIPVDGAQFLAWCKQQGGPGMVPAVRFIPSEEGPAAAPTSTRAVRLTIGFHDPETLAKGGKDLGLLLKKYLETHKD